MPVPTILRVAIGSRSTKASPAPWRPARPLPDSLRIAPRTSFDATRWSYGSSVGRNPNQAPRASPKSLSTPPLPRASGVNSVDKTWRFLGEDWTTVGLAVCFWTAPSIAQPLITAEGVVDAAGYTGGGGRLTTELARVRVLFDGVSAPLVYVFETQVSAIVPYAMAGAQSTDLVVEYAGEMSSTVTLPVEKTVPGVFTLDASGSGQGAILNQDGSLNSETNPADLGDIIVLYATGEGQTIPPGQDGLIAVSEELPAPELEVTARLGGEEADIIYAGAAPFLVASVMQVNARLATTIRSDFGAEVRHRVDGIRNQEGVTFAVVSQADLLPPGKNGQALRRGLVSQPGLRGRRQSGPTACV